ncbi:MAG: hypothetical protein NWF01_10560 [Candidatus Bathyarchaeota archaeon]|nr:hypothetical protein [Candidatus Bathyarchaeota archaeon]
MKKIASIAIILLVVASIFCGVVAAANTTGPAPNSGDGTPDGSGITKPNTPGMGPAPNSGDGNPDGSGF